MTIADLCCRPCWYKRFFERDSPGVWRSMNLATRTPAPGSRPDAPCSPGPADLGAETSLAALAGLPAAPWGGGRAFATAGFHLARHGLRCAREPQAVRQPGRVGRTISVAPSKDWGVPHPRASTVRVSSDDTDVARLRNRKPKGVAIGDAVVVAAHRASIAWCWQWPRAEQRQLLRFAAAGVVARRDPMAAGSLRRRPRWRAPAAMCIDKRRRTCPESLQGLP